MTYENAPKTKMIATHCVCCGRPLCDAQSVESGIGPICAKKYGYDKCDKDADFRLALENAKVGGCHQIVWDHMATSDARRAVNAITYLLAADPENKLRVYRIETIRALGFVKLADRLEKRLLDDTGEVSIHEDGQYLFVSTSNLPKTVFEALLVQFRSVYGRRWVPELRSNSFPVRSKSALWKALRIAAAGCRLVSEKGESVIPIYVAPESQQVLTA